MRCPRARTLALLSAFAAAQAVVALGAIVIVGPGGPLPARPAEAATMAPPMVFRVRGDPGLVEPGPDVTVLASRTVQLARFGAAIGFVPDTRPRSFRGMPIYYGAWSWWGPRIRGCESGGGPLTIGSYTAQNPRSSASGAYQVTDGSWGGAHGVRQARLATPAQQEEQAQALFLRRGTQPWAASQSCWG